MKFLVVQGDTVRNIITAPDLATAESVVPAGFTVEAYSNEQRGYIKNGAQWEAPARSFEELKAIKMSKVESQFNSRYFADYAVVDKNNNAALIQVRDEKDLNNIQLVSQAANHKDRKGNGQVKFRTKDNVIRKFASGAFADIAESLFDERQEILHIFWSKREAVIAATTQNDLDAIDPATGWP